VLFLILVFLISAGLVRAQESEFLVVEISGPVTPAMASYFERAIDAATESGASGVVIILDTPGGSIDTTLDIVRLFRNASVPIIVFVGPAGAQAASAGSIITAAAHAAGMAPETVIGAASPVDGSGADIGETLFKKISEDLKATMRNLTERRGQTAVNLAEAMIDDAKAVTAKEALEANLIDAIAPDVPILLENIDGLILIVDGKEIVLESAEATTSPFSMSAVEQILHALSNPLLIGILLTIGVQALLIELSSPGGWAAGFIGVVFLALALYGLGTLPANWFGLALIILAFILFILEVKSPSTGILAFVGIITFLVGLLVLFNSPGTPNFARISISGAVAITLFTAGFFIFIIAKVVRVQSKAPITGLKSMVGQVGPVRSDLESDDDDNFSGIVLVNGELWRAYSDEAVERGENVVVKSVDGFTLRVKKVAGKLDAL